MHAVTAETVPAVAETVRSAAAGHGAAWDQLMARYGRLVWSVARDFRLGESDASDVVQTTWLRLVEHIDRLEHPERVGAWLATTARNECLRVIASHKRLMLVGEEHGLEFMAGSHEPADETFLAAEQAKQVRDAIGQLPPRWQRLMELVLAEQPYSVIADRLSLPLGSIGPTRGRCLDRLRVLLAAA